MIRGHFLSGHSTVAKRLTTGDSRTPRGAVTARSGAHGQPRGLTARRADALSHAAAATPAATDASAGGGPGYLRETPHDADGVQAWKGNYARVTERIIADLEQGVRPWHRPWRAEHALRRIMLPRRHNGKPYRGINVVHLWGVAVVHGYAAPVWLTENRARKLHGQVRDGEEGTDVAFYTSFARTPSDEDGNEVPWEHLFMRTYTVFNTAQVDGLPERFYALPPEAEPLPERIATSERFVRATGATIEHGGDQAYYWPYYDVIQLPPLAAFEDRESYYSTALHELIHWTSHEQRLHRNRRGYRFGEPGYAREELVAEIGAAFLCAELGITPATREDHAGYVAIWLTKLKRDKRTIFRAAASAQRAVDYLTNLQPKEQKVAAG